MGIRTKHPAYLAAVDRWRRCRDAYEGQDAIHSGGKLYLPSPDGMSATDYNAYRDRALFYEAVGRTVDGFVGAISRRDPIIDAPERLQTLLRDATLSGLTMAELTKQLCRETILMGRCGVLVDYDNGAESPLLAFYRAEDIVNWGSGFIVLSERVYEPDPIDRFKMVPVEQYRELRVIDGVYTAQLWRKPDSRGEFAPFGAPIIPTRRGQTFDAIPWQWLTPLGNTSDIVKPPLLGLVHVAISHYRTSADLEHGSHFTGLPTLYVTGISDPDQQIRVGSMSAITVPDANARVGYAEFSGQGLKSLETALEQKQGMMAVLGASVFHDSKRGVEAAETARIRTSGETSLLTGAVTAVEETLTAALKTAAEWVAASGDVSVTLNREFIDTRLDGQTLTALVGAYQTGAMTIEQFLFSLQQGDMLRPDTDIDAEAEAVRAGSASRE